MTFHRTSLLVAALLAATPALVRAEPADPAAGQVEAFSTAATAIMKQGKALGLGGRTTRFTPVVKQYYDLPTMTALVVGPAWTGYSAGDRALLIEAFTHHSAVSHAVNFDRYDGERFIVDPKVDARGVDRLVKMTIASGSDATRIGYRMRMAQGQWKIIDVLSGGVSQLSVQRSDFAATLKAGGAAALARKLKEIDARTMAGG